MFPSTLRGRKNKNKKINFKNIHVSERNNNVILTFPNANAWTSEIWAMDQRLAGTLTNHSWPLIEECCKPAETQIGWLILLYKFISLEILIKKCWGGKFSCPKDSVYFSYEAGLLPTWFLKSYHKSKTHTFETYLGLWCRHNVKPVVAQYSNNRYFQDDISTKKK